MADISIDPTVEQNEDDRQERLRRNTAIDPGSKTDDEMNPMHPDSWSGGSINPEAKKVARGEVPANRERGPGFPPPAVPATPPSVTRPWAPGPVDETSEVDHSGRIRNKDGDDS